MKKIAILGNTGNVGTQTLEIVEKYPDKLKIIAPTLIDFFHGATEDTSGPSVRS